MALRLNYDNRSTYILRRRMWMVGSLPRTPSLSPQVEVPTHAFSLRLLSAFIGRSVRIRQCLRSFFITLVPSSFAPCAFLFLFLNFWSVAVLDKKKKEPDGRYALSYLGFSFLLLLSRHLPPVSSASRTCGTPPHAVLLRGAAVLRSRRLFCRLEWPRAWRSIRIWRYYRGRMAGYTPKSKDRLAFV
jgi:hypothetical protein